MALRPLPLVLILLSGPAAQAESPRVHRHQLHGWTVYSGDHAIAGRWGLHLEGQWRRHDVIVRPQQAMLRPAVNLQLTPSLAFSTGYGYVMTHRYGDSPLLDPFPEHRVYQQLSVRHGGARVEWQQRFRFEERWLKLRLPATSDPRWHYQNRFRYMLRASVPIGKGGWYAAGWNELLVNIPPAKGAAAFDQNRAFLGLGKKLEKATRVEAGYVQQTLRQRTGRVMEFNHTLQVGIYSTLRFR